MKKITRKLFAAISFITFSCFAAAEEVSFASFNLYWLFDERDPQLNNYEKYRGKVGQSYQDALNKVAQKIKAIDADVIALQEIENEEVLKELQSALNQLGLNYPHRFICGCKDPTGQDVALLSKFSASGTVVTSFNHERKLYLTEEDRFNESETGLSKSLMVPLNIKDEVVNVFVFHLKSQRGGYVADKQRQAQAKIVRRITLPYLNKNENVIVMGDLNAEPGSKTLHTIRGFDDVYTNLYQTTNDDDFQGNKSTYIFNGRNQQIDHILLSRDLHKRFSSGQVYSGHGKDVSDHNAIKVSIDRF